MAPLKIIYQLPYLRLEDYTDLAIAFKFFESLHLQFIKIYSFFVLIFLYTIGFSSVRLYYLLFKKSVIY